MSSLKILPLADDLPYGSKVAGVTHEMTTDAGVRAELNQVFEERGMIVFSEVEPSGQMQVAISEIFGPLKEHPVPSVARADAERMPGVIEITANPGACIVEINGKPLITWQPWHFDHAYNDELNRAGVLRSIKIATDGGKTGFADGIQIWNDMDPAIRAKAEGLELLYTLNLNYDDQLYGLPEGFRQIKSHDQDWRALSATKPRSIHPAIWQRKTGEKVFHMTPYGSPGIVGNETSEGIALLQEVWDEAMRVMKPYYHAWHPTDMVIWDNWRMLHEACGSNPNEERVVHRTTIKGDYGLGRFETPAVAA